MSPPIPILHTPRLVLREPCDADIDAIHELHRHKAVADGVLTIPHPHTIDDARAWLVKVRTPREERLDLVWMVCERASGSVIGDCGVHIEIKHRRGTLGYLVHPDHWGRGIVTEAIGAVVHHTFNSMDPSVVRLEADHYPENPASGRVLEKLGFAREGVLRSFVIKNGRPRDVVRWGLVNPNGFEPN